jgi:hypothetical protein
MRRRAKDTACPRLVWAYIHAANRRSEPWQRNRDEWARKLLRIIARSPTIFPSKNPDLKSSLKELELEWLTPSQISRIRECSAPRRKVPRNQWDRWFGWGSADPRSTTQEPKCRRLFWAWRSDQKTCDAHWWAASMLRVQKHRKANKDRERNAIQLKEARRQLKRKRRAYKRLQKLIRITPASPLTPSQLQAQSDRADLQLLKLIRIGYEVEAGDSDRLEAMIRNGYVVPDDAEPNTYKLSGQGLRHLADLRKRVGRGPALTQ